MDELEKLKRENLHLRCVMREAAAELLAFWEFHTSEGGRGPHLLLDRLTGVLPTSHDENPYPHRHKEVSNVEP
jgi:hypothetical protein